MLGEHLRLTADAAYVRALSQKAVDDHYFTFGIDPASGSGNGFLLEAIAAYQFTNAFSPGVGGRWAPIIPNGGGCSHGRKDLNLIQRCLAKSAQHPVR
jgi:hypothetical protein